MTRHDECGFGAVVGVVEGLTVVRVVVKTVVKQFIPASSYKAGPALRCADDRCVKGGEAITQ